MEVNAIPGMTEHPLVTIAVTAYNSALTIVETLESILAQTYQPLELIVSDDSSTDNTLAVVEAWLANSDNTTRFIRTEMLTVPHNTGVSANCNRCINAASGNWVKFIAGDDILLPNCIKDNMSFVAKHPSISILFSQVRVYKYNFETPNYLRTTPAKFPENLMHPDYSAKDQFELLLIGDRIHFTPSYFFKKEALLAVGGYDENNRLIEDYPMWLKLTRSGYRLNYHHTETVGYRMHDRALNNQVQAYIFKPLALRGHTIRKQEVHPYLPWEIVRKEHWQHAVRTFFHNRGWNKPTALYSFLFRLFTVYLNPFQYLYSIKKRIGVNTDSRFYQ